MVEYGQTPGVVTEQRRHIIALVELISVAKFVRKESIRSDFKK